MCATRTRWHPSRKAPRRVPALIAAAGPSQRCRACECEQVLSISPDTPLRHAAQVDRPCVGRSGCAGDPQGLGTVEVSDR